MKSASTSLTPTLINVQIKVTSAPCAPIKRASKKGKKWEFETKISKLTKRATIYFGPNVHKALRIRAAKESRSISDIIHEALNVLFMDDAEDIKKFDTLSSEHKIGKAEFVQ